MIVDANVVLRAFFPDEAQEIAQRVLGEHIAGRSPLQAPDLLPYELSNAVWQAERRGRITTSQAEAALGAMRGLKIETMRLEMGDMLPMARRFGCSAYDAAYLQLAEMTHQPLLTGDLRLYHLVHPALDWVIWIEEFRD